MRVEIAKCDSCKILIVDYSPIANQLYICGKSYDLCDACMEQYMLNYGRDAEAFYKKAHKLESNGIQWIERNNNGQN